jgi:endonuclease YncB( thermonuclease family)
MPFIQIQGTFHLVGRTQAGNPTGFQPDGDSIQFQPANPQLLNQLDQPGRPYRLTSIGSTQLRLEGIDALELHFDSTHQPRPLADEARDFLTGKLGLNPVPYRPPRNIQVQPPVAKDATGGFILSRALEVNGRPIAFAFTSTPPAADGAEVFLRSSLLRRSLNYRSPLAGQAYPLFYDTLFADLRAVLTQAATTARQAGSGLWPQDRSQAGLQVTGQAELEQQGVVFPKLFRRLSEFLAQQQPGGLAGLLAWLAASEEQVLDLPAGNFTHFDNVVAVEGDQVRLLRRPEELVFVSAKTTSPTVAPWLRL